LEGGDSTGRAFDYQGQSFNFKTHYQKKKKRKKKKQLAQTKNSHTQLVGL
jgi:hypothetical protein